MGDSIATIGLILSLVFTIIMFVVGVMNFVLSHKSNKAFGKTLWMGIGFMVILCLVVAGIFYHSYASSAPLTSGGVQLHAPTTTATSLPKVSVSTTPTYDYRADWSQGPGDWSLASHWSWSGADGGMLVTDGSENDSWIFPTTQIPNPNYTLQVKIRRLSYTNAGGPSFGAVVRYTHGVGGYVSGVGAAIQSQPEHYFIALGAEDNGQPVIDHDLDQDQMTVDQQWHTYRIDVQGNHITLSVDGLVVISITDSTYTSSGQVGLYASAAVINVEDFTVLSLAA